MATTLKEWDTEVVPHLSEIERHCRWIEHHAAEIVKRVELLKERPSFETKAQVALETAELMIGGARREYLSKPMERKNADEK